MENESIFGVEPEQLKELLSIGDDELDDSSPRNERPPSRENQSSEDKSELPEPGTAMDAFNEKPGSWIGPYKLLSVLGEGGMGIAYLAEQKQPMRRQVAIKVIKPGMDSRRVISRFEAERQALALLDHPNIAHVYDAGTTELGRPYFVMEYVKGLPITDYCDHHKLTVEERLDLFLQVCQAVHHAHQKGIIHRDIKPSNILVSVDNDRPTPKIIDFGVAKALGRPLTDRTVFTEDNQLLGTPEYMSPEQVDMATEDIDIRSDVYSLGVLLYVLLTGVLPFDPQTLRDSGIENIRKTIRETDPKTPSTRLTSLGEKAEKVAESRRTEVTTLAKCLHKELEWIPLKAMRKERSERYRSASELADDIENYLNGVPLIAGPPTSLYRIKKFVRRNRTMVAGAVTVLLVLVAGTVISTNFAISAERARADARAIANFLNSNLGAVITIKGRDATVIDILNDAVEKLNEGEFRDQPLIEEEICRTLAWNYRMLGDHRAAIPLLERVCQIMEEQHGVHAELTLKRKGNLALACTYAGQYKRAEHLLNEIIAIHRRHHPEIVGGLPMSMGSLSIVYKVLGRYEEAERLISEAWKFNGAWWEPYLGRREAKPFQDHMADIYVYQGRYEEAEQMYKDMKEKEYPMYGDRVYNWGSVDGWPRLYIAQGQYKEAEELLIKGIEIRRQGLPGKDNPLTLKFINCLAVLRTKQECYPEAEKLFEEVLEARQRKLGEDHPSTLETINDFGVLRREQKRFGEAESLLRQALEARQSKLGNDHPACFETMYELAVLYKEQDRHEESEELFLKAVEGRRLKLGDTHPHTIESIKNLIDLYEAWNKPEKSEHWRAKVDL